MTPMRRFFPYFLCLASICLCRAEEAASSGNSFFTHENRAVRLVLSSDNAELQRLVNLGLKECLYGSNEGAYNYFDEALREDASCVLAHIGMMMIHPQRSNAYRHHLRQLNTAMEQAVLTPVEEWYISTLLQYLNGDYAGAAQAFKERAARYRRDHMAACWDIVLNLAAREQGSSLQSRADALMARLPDAPLAHYLRALVEQQAPTPSAAAMQASQRAVELTQRAPHPLIHQLAGHLQFRLGESRQALKHFQSIAACSDPTAEAYQAARLYQIAAYMQLGDRKNRIEALKAARQLASDAAHTSPDTDAGTLLYWEGRTILLRLLVLQETAPAGPAINMAAQSCQTPENTLLRLVQDCLVAAIRCRTLADTQRHQLAMEQWNKAEQFFTRLQREGEEFKRGAGMSHLCFKRAERACAGALFRARLALYPDSASIWQGRLDEILTTPEERLLPPVLPKAAD